jgi:hypothetical protein
VCFALAPACQLTQVASHNLTIETTEKENTLKPNNTIKEILDALASPDRQVNDPLIFRLDAGLIQDALNTLSGYRKIFAPVIPGLTDTSAIYESYERMRLANESREFLLLLVECQTAQQFREALGPLRIRHSSEWRVLDEGQNYAAEL